MLEEGSVIANHKLVSFHAAFLSSLLSIPFIVGHRTDVLNSMFNPVEKEVIFSAIIWYLGWHLNIAIHELGYWIAAVKTNNLRPEQLREAQKNLNFGGYLKGFFFIPWGKFRGIKKEAGCYFPDVKAQNLAVSAAGPSISGKLSLVTLPLGIVSTGITSME
jgi:hypothetical protein